MPSRTRRTSLHKIPVDIDGKYLSRPISGVERYDLEHDRFIQIAIFAKSTFRFVLCLASYGSSRIHYTNGVSRSMVELVLLGECVPP